MWGILRGMETNNEIVNMDNLDTEQAKAFIASLVAKVENGTSTEVEENFLSSYVDFVEDTTAGLVAIIQK